MTSERMTGIKEWLVSPNGVHKEGSWGGMFDLIYGCLKIIFGVMIMLLEKEELSPYKFYKFKCTMYIQKFQLNSVLLTYWSFG